MIAKDVFKASLISVLLLNQYKNTVHIQNYSSGPCVCENTSKDQDIKNLTAVQGSFTSLISEPPSNNSSTADGVEIQKQFSLMEMVLYWSSSWINWIHVMSV